MKRFFWYSFPLLAWFTFCTILLTLPGSAFPKEDWLDKIWADKWIHIGLFAALAFLAGRAYYYKIPMTNRARYFLLCGTLALLYGIIMEFIQKYFIPNRSFDATDMLADGIGSYLGAWICTRFFIKKIDPCGNRGRNQN